MSVLTLAPHRPPARHRRRRFVGAKAFMSVKIPKAVNDAWNAAERNPVGAAGITALVSVLAAVSLWVAGWALALALVSLVVGVGIGRGSKGGPR